MPHIKEITPEETAAMLDRGDEFLLIDVREDGEWAAGHIEGAIHMGKGIIERDIEGTVFDKSMPLVLYCGVDEGWCRAMATRREDLSLLGNMTEKERAKCREKGITTIAQLSYGYRPRRRRHAKSTPQHGPPPVRHDHKLKALAIKKAQVHVVGYPDLSIEGTPVFLDVEGMPDRDFHHLIGRFA